MGVGRWYRLLIHLQMVPNHKTEREASWRWTLRIYPPPPTFPAHFFFFLLCAFFSPFIILAVGAVCVHTQRLSVCLVPHCCERLTCALPPQKMKQLRPFLRVCMSIQAYCTRSTAGRPLSFEWVFGYILRLILHVFSNFLWSRIWILISKNYGKT